MSKGSSDRYLGERQRCLGHWCRRYRRSRSLQCLKEIIHQQMYGLTPLLGLIPAVVIHIDELRTGASGSFVRNKGVKLEKAIVY